MFKLPVLQRWGQLILYALLLLFPLASFPPTKVFYNSLDTPRRLLLMLGAGLLSALIVKAWAMRRQVVVRWHFLDAFVLLYLAGCIASSCFGAYPRVSFFGPVWSQDGLILLWINVCLYFAVKEFLRTREEVERAIAMMIYIGGVVAVIGFIDRYIGLKLNPNFDDPTVSNNLRMVATLGNPMFTATYFAILVPLGFALAMATKHQAQRIATLCCTMVIFFAMVLTMSRAAWIGLAVSIILVAILSVWQVLKNRAHVAEVALENAPLKTTDDHNNRVQIRQLNQIRTGVDVTVLVLILGFIFAIILVAIHNPQIKDRIKSITNFDNDTIKTRQIYMITSIEMFKHNLVAGAGVGNLKALFPQYRPFSLIYESGLPLNRGYSTAYPHNLFIETAAETGLLGLVPFVLLTVLIFYTAFTARKNSPWQSWLAIGLLGAMTVYYVTNMFSFDNAATQAQFWICASLLAGFSAQERVFFARADGKTMSWRAVSLWNFIGVVLVCITVLNTLTQFYASVCVQSGANALSHINEMMQQNPQLGFQSLTDGLNDVQQGVNCTLVHDNVAYEILCMGYKIQKDITGDASVKETALKKMFQAGEDGLALMERDPLLLRYMVMEYAATGKDEYLAKGDALIAKLLRFEPHSSEVRVIQGELLLQEKKIGEALGVLYKAQELDPTFKEVYAKLAHDRQLLVQQTETNIDKLAKEKKSTPEKALAMKKTQMMPMIKKVIGDYAKAEELGLDLLSFDRVMYAIDLFMAGEVEKGIEEGVKLHETGSPDDFKQLCRALPAIYQFTGRPNAEFQRVMAQVNPPPAPAAPPPSAQAPPAPPKKPLYDW